MMFWLSRKIDYLKFLFGIDKRSVPELTEEINWLCSEMLSVNQDWINEYDSEGWVSAVRIPSIAPISWISKEEFDQLYPPLE